MDEERRQMKKEGRTNVEQERRRTQHSTAEQSRAEESIAEEKREKESRAEKNRGEGKSRAERRVILEFSLPGLR